MRVTCFELLDRGDLAIREHDFTTLARIARHLERRVGDPIAARCHAFARACDNRQNSAQVWERLREEIGDRVATAGS